MFVTGLVPFEGGVGMTRPLTRTLTSPLRRTLASPLVMTHGAPPGGTPKRTGPVGWLPNTSDFRTVPPWRSLLWPFWPFWPPANAVVAPRASATVASAAVKRQG